MRRWAFNGMAAASLLLCVAAAVLWARSYSGGHQCGWTPRLPDRPLYGAQALRGRLELMALHPPYGPRPPGFSHGGADRDSWAELPWAAVRGRDWLGAGFRAEQLAPGFNARVVWVPIWWISAAAALLPCVWLVRLWRRGRRWHGGLCLGCGYDLRASPATCPECGRAVAERAGG